MSDPRQMVLGAYFTGREGVAWRHPSTADLLDIRSFVQNARIAEDALLHFHFMAESLNLPETAEGQLAWSGNNGRHDVMTAHSAMIAETSRIGFVSTVNSTFNEPYDLARKLATFDLLSGGRTAWNIVTSQPPTTVANFGHRSYAGYEERYAEGLAFLSALQSAWRGDSAARPEPSWPLPPQQEGPLIFTASMSPSGADFAAAVADGAFILPSSIEHARELYAQTKDRLEPLGRDRSLVRVIAGRDIVVADTVEEAWDKFHSYVDYEITDRDVIAGIEKIWFRDLSDLDPDGPLPQVGPDRDAAEAYITAAPGQAIRDPDEYVAHWTEVARTSRQTCREFVRATFLSGGPGGVARGAFIGTPESVADDMEHWFRTGAADGFIIQPHVVPLGIREFTRYVVPVLQDRGLFRTHDEGGTLRDVWHHP